MTNKDFLDQFTGKNNKPDSFKEEERVKVVKDKKPINVKLLVIILAIVALIVGLVLFFVLRPTIEVKNFVEANVSEVKAWIKQNEIDTQGIIFKEEYNFDLDEGYVISQSIPVGTKVRKDVKMDFVVSLGADPDELISVPDIATMYKDELQEWIKENKLTKTKIMTAYSDEKPEGEVISYEFKSGADADNFKRSSSLTITISKGPQPAGRIVVPDFSKKYFSEVETWGKQNNITITKVENYSDKVEKDLVISQSVEAKKEMKEGETLSVVVSLGKGIKVPNFVSMSKEDIDEWINENGGYCKVKEMYSSNDAYVIEQSIKSGNFIDEENKLRLTINKGNHFYLDEIGFVIEGNSYDKFKDFASELEGKGIYIDTHKNYIDSVLPKGTIISINKIYDDSNEYSKVQRLPLVVEITCDVSNGLLEKEKFVYTDFVNQKASVLNDWIKTHYSIDNLEYNIDIKGINLDEYVVTGIDYKENKDDKEYKDINTFDGSITAETIIHVYITKS